MPIYTYECGSCGIQFERLQKFSDKPLSRCPECQKGKVRRVMQPPAIVFKGSGWYATDHRSPSGQTRPKTEAESGGAKTDTEAEKPKPAKKAAKPADAE